MLLCLFQTEYENSTVYNSTNDDSKLSLPLGLSIACLLLGLLVNSRNFSLFAIDLKTCAT